MRFVPSVSRTHSSMIPNPFSSSQVVFLAPPRMKTFFTSSTPRSLSVFSMLFSTCFMNTSSSWPSSTSSSAIMGLPSSSMPWIMGMSFTRRIRATKSSALSSDTMTFKSLPYSLAISAAISFILIFLSTMTTWFNSMRSTQGDSRWRKSSVSSPIS